MTLKKQQMIIDYWSGIKIGYGVEKAMSETLQLQPQGV
jgi:hypothetical protein